MRDLRKRLVHATDEREHERLTTEVEGFMLDVREDVFEKLRSGLPAAQFLAVYAAIQNKLADAMAKDPEVRALLQTEGADEVRFPTSGIGVFELDVDSWAELEAGHGRLLASYTRD